MINQSDIIKQIVDELSVAYLAAGRSTPSDNVMVVAGSLAENIPFQSVEQVHAVFNRAKDIDPIPTQKTLKEAFKNYGEEYLKYRSIPTDNKAIGYRDPRAAWLPADDRRKRINLTNAIKNYCDALGESAAYQYMQVHRTKTEIAGDRKVVKWENPDAVEAFDAPIKDYLRYLYTKYIRSLPIYAGYPAEAKLNLGLIPPSIEEFKTMLRAEGQIK